MDSRMDKRIKAEVTRRPENNNQKTTTTKTTTKNKTKQKKIIEILEEGKFIYLQYIKLILFPQRYQSTVGTSSSTVFFFIL